MLQVKEEDTSQQAQWLRKRVEESVAHLQVRSFRSKRCASRGSVRIFTTGVSNQSAFLVMLETAYQAQFGGADVTVGFVAPSQASLPTEPEQKSANKQDYLLRGFECLTPLAGTAVGRVKGWFDVAAAVTRAPDIVLIEAPLTVSHSFDAYSGIDTQIWHRAEEVDVMELLLAGINVWVAVDTRSNSQS
jgi:K+-sensing histidine kinase KdpD